MGMQDYLDFLTSLRQMLDTLNGLEQRKIAAVKAGDFEALDQCMKEEQAATLDLRGREQKRIGMLKELGLEKVSLRDLPAHYPPESRNQAAEITQQLLRSYEVLASAQKAARTLMESNLNRINEELARRQTPQPAETEGSHSEHRQPTDFRV